MSQSSKESSSPPSEQSVGAFVDAISTQVLFVLHLPDGRQIQLSASGAEGLSGTGIKLENRLAALRWLLPREMRA
jgi:hypothetical protein